MYIINTNNIFYPKYLEDISPELILETLRMIVYSYRHHTLKYKSDVIISLKKNPVLNTWVERSYWNLCHVPFWGPVKAWTGH